MIEAEVIRSSLNKHGVRITTMELTYPRYIHAEFMTHRVFSRNAASSRAIPVRRQLGAIWKQPVIPISWGSNKKGMQAGKEISEFKQVLAFILWSAHRYMSLGTAFLISGLGVHKQHANRLVEAHSHIRVLVTSTDWENFLYLRDHPDAMPEIQRLAECIRAALAANIPQYLEEDEWHLPYIEPADVVDIDILVSEDPTLDVDQCMLYASVARCARVSYTTFGNVERPIVEDIALGKRILAGDPMHASPAEHQAKPNPEKKKSGNFRAWIQYRKTFPGEYRMDGPYKGPYYNDRGELADWPREAQSTIGQPAATKLIQAANLNRR